MLLPQDRLGYCHNVTGLVSETSDSLSTAVMQEECPAL
jgi:hypothetical protein